MTGRILLVLLMPDVRGIVGSPQVSFPMCTLEIPQKIAVQVLLLLTLFTFTFEPFLKL